MTESRQKLKGSQSLKKGTALGDICIYTAVSLLVCFLSPHSMEQLELKQKTKVSLA